MIKLLLSSLLLASLLLSAPLSARPQEAPLPCLGHHFIPAIVRPFCVIPSAASIPRFDWTYVNSPPVNLC